MEDNTNQTTNNNNALDLRAVKNMLMIMVIPLIFYLLKLLALIFIPLASALFLSILFTPLMRWMKKKKLPKLMALIAVVLIIFCFFKISGELVQLSSHEIMNSNTSELLVKMENKLLDVVTPIEQFFGVDTELGDKSIHKVFKENDDGSNLLNYFGNTIQFLQKLVLIY